MSKDYDDIADATQREYLNDKESERLENALIKYSTENYRLRSVNARLVEALQYVLSDYKDHNSVDFITITQCEQALKESTQ